MIDFWEEVAERERKNSVRFADKVTGWCVVIGCVLILLEWGLR